MFPGQMHLSPATERSRTPFSGLLFNQKGCGRRSAGGLKSDTSRAGDVWEPPHAKHFHTPLSAWLALGRWAACTASLKHLGSGRVCIALWGEDPGPDLSITTVFLSVLTAALPAGKCLGYLLPRHGALKSLIRFQKLGQGEEPLRAGQKHCGAAGERCQMSQGSGGRGCCSGGAAQKIKGWASQRERNPLCCAADG